MRSLTFSDDKDNEQEWVPGGPTDALGAFLEFIDRHRADDNALFCITDERDEGLVLWLDHGIVARVIGGAGSAHRVPSRQRRRLSQTRVHVHPRRLRQARPVRPMVA
ncbi:hypothetical protein GA0070561_5008 [Micromonospora saelicesensis]|uniref:Uncharacterized protein n=2 Tax=Micromonospora saelicesensis TaxID=285676 RepID=A0A1C4Z700_9ACTN|nr:hypothetical protein GA0070561_5008 [Micromonospora saelicesensis]